MKLNLPKQLIISSVIAIVISIAGAAGLIILLSQSQVSQLGVLSENISLLEKSLTETKNQLGGDVQRLTNQLAQTQLALGEVKKQQAVKPKTQEEILAAVVAKVTPSVVSIVISKDVAQLEVTYENPFSNDPTLKDFGVRVPVYRQKGTVKQKIGSGSGFIISADGYILSNKHVVADESATYTALLASGVQKTANVVYRDPDNDLAVLKIDGKYTPLALGDSVSLKLGRSVVAIGNALGEFQNSVSLGIISGLDRTIDAKNQVGQIETITGVIQTDAAINPGNSGGPLVDLEGKAVGVNVATVLGSNSIGFAIPISVAREILKKNLNLRV